MTVTIASSRSSSTTSIALVMLALANPVASIMVAYHSYFSCAII